MTIDAVRRTFTGFCMTFIALTVLTVTGVAQPQTVKKETVKGTPIVTTSQLKGTVVLVEGNNLAVRMSTGELRHFTPAPDRKVIIDGKELTVRDLKPGTKLTATYTTTTTPATERTTQITSGKVWYRSGQTVIFTLPNGENKMYTIKDTDPVKFFDSEGKEMTVFDLKKGMTVSATRIIQEPRTELATDVVVTGEAPKTEVAQAQTRPSAPPPSRPAARPAPAPAPAQARAAQLPAELPKTGSPLPLAGMLGLLFTSASIGIRRLRRSWA